MKWLMIGSVVKAKGYLEPLMIIKRGVLLPMENEFVYCDYAAIEIYKQFERTKTIFLNQIDIDEVVKQGYGDDLLDRQEQAFFENVVSKGIAKYSSTQNNEERKGF